jgi:SMC interacting uncharacterized protein involved in chromosome segregation
MADTERQIAEHQQRIQAVTQEQNRIRDNMKTVDSKSDYYQRLLKKLNDQESSIEKLQGETDELRKTLDKQREDLERSLQNMNVG